MFIEIKQPNLLRGLGGHIQIGRRKMHAHEEEAERDITDLRENSESERRSA